MGFFNSAVNQVGRDLGKVVSNQLFKNDHASVHRIIRSNEYSNTIRRRGRSINSDYEKAIAFQLSFRPDTLINKLVAVYIIIKNKLNEYLEDEYMDEKESQEFFEMLVGFHSKVEDIGEVLALDALKNSAALDKLNKLITNMTVLVSDSMEWAARGCLDMEEYYLERSSRVEIISFGRYVGLHLLCMRGYAKGGEKRITRAIFACLASIFVFPVVQIIFLFQGLFTYDSYKSKMKMESAYYQERADLEYRKQEVYEGLVSKDL